MIIEAITLGTITLTYKPPQPPLEVGYPVPKIELVQPLEMPEAVEYKPAVQKPLKQAVNGSEGNTYQPGQCVWYIKNMRPEIPNGWGSAHSWLANARKAGWPTGSEPRVGAVGVKGNHVVLIEAVHGSLVTYSDMNGRWVPFEIGRRTAPATNYQYIY